MVHRFQIDNCSFYFISFTCFSKANLQHLGMSSSCLQLRQYHSHRWTKLWENHFLNYLCFKVILRLLLHLRKHKHSMFTQSIHGLFFCVFFWSFWTLLHRVFAFSSIAITIVLLCSGILLYRPSLEPTTGLSRIVKIVNNTAKTIPFALRWRSTCWNGPIPKAPSLALSTSQVNTFHPNTDKQTRR